MTESRASSVPTPDRDLAALLEFAVGAALRAGEDTLRWFGRAVPIDTKVDGTPVSLADREAEARLRSLIRERFPDDALLGEEEGTSGEAGAPWRWILDPIDGTRSFVRGVPLYAVLVGVEFRGHPLLGVLHFPALGETLAAARGQGCHANGVRCRASGVRHLRDAVALTSDPAITAQSPVAEGWSDLVARVDYSRTWGDAYGHAMVARGRADIMLDPLDLKAWDAAPLLPVIEEAGGRFTDLNGEPTIHGGSGLSTNGLLHEEVLRVLNGKG